MDESPYKGEYRRECVYAIRNMVAKNLSVPHRFVSLSDDLGMDVRTIPLVHDWPGWWAKMELFRPGIFAGGKVLYFDLDTFINKPIDRLLDVPGNFVMLRDFMFQNVPASGVMMWHGDHHELYRDFRDNADYYMANHRSCGSIGDQAVIGKHIKAPSFWQDHTPSGFFQSFKLSGRRENLADVPVVCFHGKPKPWDGGGWAEDHWKLAAGVL